MIAKKSKTDLFLAKVTDFIINGWPAKVENSWRHVFSLRFDLEVVKGCILFQDRVFIPVSLRHNILKLLHTNHNGIVKMKQMTRRSLFRFDLNKDIEQFVKNCEPCIKMSVVPKQDCHTFLLVVGSHTKWLEVEIMKYGTDANKVIRKFTAIFARFGLPDVLVTDGGPPFNSGYFVAFMERQGIKVMKSPSYNPSSNVHAEKMVRLVKDVLSMKRIKLLIF